MVELSAQSEKEISGSSDDDVKAVLIQQFVFSHFTIWNRNEEFLIAV